VLLVTQLLNIISKPKLANVGVATYCNTITYS